MIAIASVGVSMTGLFVQQASAKVTAQVHDAFHFNTNQGNDKQNLFLHENFRNPDSKSEHVTNTRISPSEPTDTTNSNFQAHTTIKDKGDNNFNTGQVTKTNDGQHLNEHCHGDGSTVKCK